ncbi:nose resistant to fluoxetine protein 6 [Trichonephila clavata]|uniref:Nose resistant to fluoxetine protein 6 n=1 Tax=Trichonephila clavata TaxID=2740835 RepID=A0A8X6K4C3_TRICU|nr:nose resistant to fluoxetine protein 6 [Trichonephila clavata]
MSLGKHFLIFSLALIACNNYLVFCQEEEETNTYSSYNFVKLVEKSVKHLSASKSLHSIPGEGIFPLQDILKDYVNPNVFIEALLQPATNKCSEDLTYLQRNTSILWTMKMLDSYGKPGSGILSGNIKWLGDYDECVGVYVPPQENSSLGDFQGRYCGIDFSLPYKNATLPINVGICLPDSCNFNGKLFNASYFDYTDYIPYVGRSIDTLLNTTTITCRDTSRKLTTGAISVICLISVFVFLTLIGSSITVIKYYTKRNVEMKNGTINTSSVPIINDPIEKPSQNGSGDILIAVQAERKTQPAWYEKCDEFFNCFCVFTNGKKILDTSNTEGQLPCLHGVRFFSMSWVIFCHTYAFCFTFVSNASETLTLIDHWLFQIILNGFYSVDSFFLLSGFLVAYLFFQQSAKNKDIPWLYFYIHRFIRLTPVYMIVLAFHTTLFGYLGSGPVWAAPNTDPNCHSTWWWNLLYINNFQFSVDMCMGWSWYLANDMQFYFISPLFLITLLRWPKIGHSVMALFFGITFITNFVLTYEYNLITGIGNISVLAQSLTEFLAQWSHQFDKIYTKPYTRIGPYLVGILLAYFFIKRKQNNAGKLRMITLCLGWMVASGVTLTCLFGLYNNNPNTVAASFYNALNRICFACGLAWVIFVCLIGQGGFVNSILSWKFFFPPSRLTFCAYLVHPIVQSVYYNSLRTLVHFSHITMVMYCFGFLFFAYMAAFVTSLLFESPIIRLERLIRNKFTS